jgi:ApeA N-terminal domain 1
MSSFDIEPGKRIHCQELNTGKGYPGFFYFDDKIINAELCSYDQSFDLYEKNPVFLRAESNKIISLHSNIITESSSRTGNLRTHKQRIISNAAVIGHDRWEATDRIKTVTFQARRAKEMLRHREKFDKLVKTKRGDPDDLFSETANGMTIRGGYAGWYSLEYDSVRDISTVLEIEFEAGPTLFEYLEYASALVNFFSFSIGAHMQPSDIRIFRLSRKQLMEAMEAQVFPGDHSVQYAWPEVPVEDLDLWVGGSLVTAWDDEQLAALRKCIVTWMERHPTWKKANIQMMQCLASKGEISADRLLAACKWFEEIPLTKTQGAIADEHLGLIVQTATQKASELGYEKLTERIAGALRYIKTESHEQRFLRLVDRLTEKFGSGILGDAVLADLKRAIAFRGVSAHGHFNPEDEAEFRAFQRAIYAMEALCFLLTAYELPISARGIERARSNPFIRDYSLACESRF